MLLPREAELDVLNAFGLIVPIEPRGKERPRARLRRKKDGTIGLGARQPKGNVVWKDEFLLLAAAGRRAAARAIKEISEGRGTPLRVELELFYRKPKRAEWFCTSPVDNDNAEKMVWDAMQGTFFKNDNRIVSNETMKDWSDGAPYLKVRVIPLKRKIA